MNVWTQVAEKSLLNVQAPSNEQTTVQLQSNMSHKNVDTQPFVPVSSTAPLQNFEQHILPSRGIGLTKTVLPALLNIVVPNNNSKIVRLLELKNFNSFQLNVPEKNSPQE